MDVRTGEGPRPNLKNIRREQRPPFDCIALLLQGGGALGAYQAGVYQGLAEANLQPDWVAGISIGAVNSALIAGNPPESRLEKLRKFWEIITAGPFWPWAAASAGDGARPALHELAARAMAAATIGPLSLAVPLAEDAAAQADGVREFWCRLFSDAATMWSPERIFAPPPGDLARSLANQMSAGLAAGLGAAGFFAPRALSPWLQPAGTLDATSYYDTAALMGTLERLVDFDRINSGEMRFSVGAVNVATGNFVYFDNTTHTITPEHVIASGALPPGFPPIEIEGQHYWDGGLMSNTPLLWVMESEPRQDTLAFQVDLWSARGTYPRTMAEVVTRQKEIQYSSRTRANSDRFKQHQLWRNALGGLLANLPDSVRETNEYKMLSALADRKSYNVIQLIYRASQYEGDSKDYEFSRQSMDEHWRAGYHDTVRTLRHPEVLERPTTEEGVFVFDLAVQGRG
jgi:NTE family protein